MKQSCRETHLLGLQDRWKGRVSSRLFIPCALVEGPEVANDLEPRVSPGAQTTDQRRTPTLTNDFQHVQCSKRIR